MTLQYSYVGDALPLPLPRPNGGLFVGAPFRPGAAWANVPVAPETHEHALLLAAQGSPGAAQAPFGAWPGNNEPRLVFHEPFDERTHPGLMCLRR